MRIICNKLELIENLSVIQRAVSPKSNISAIEGVLLTAKSDNTLGLCGYNLEFGIKTNINIEVEKEGSVVLPAKLFTEIVRRSPEDLIKIEVFENLKTDIRSGCSNFSLSGISFKEFPDLPRIENPEFINLDVDVIKSMIKQTIFAVSDDISKPVYTGILFEIKNFEIILVALDGYRMALRKENIKENLNLRFVVPGKTMNEILRLLSNTDVEKLEVCFGINYIEFKIGKHNIISRLLQDEFLDYNVSIPKNAETMVEISTRNFKESIERVSLLILERLKTSVCCKFSRENIELSCETSMGKAKDVIKNVEFVGNELEIGFNSKFMLDVLKSLDTDIVILELCSPIKPIKFVPKSRDGNFVFLLLPVRLKN
ncbi:MAG: DNA polymerase III subunit beta [Candidatus Paraimprobicoccus trichonymphae]|uniref:Beta sliding clamp n=1 Tax=Candidatus Paraimprobicoccus trichonymphae TaxID=3033793 RepID=A0AA48KY10_9FIRM|nr:MAG: DNA polymerase III subunit beta [Candidatus Paraimprobicoccus trichonymphae]